MAKGASLVSVGPVEVDKDKLLAKITRTTVWVSKLRELADRRAAEAERVANEYYDGAIAAIEDQLVEGVTGARAYRRSLTVKGPDGVVGVRVRWKPLASSWIKRKQAQGSAGASSFWLYKGRMHRAFRSGVKGKGKAQVTVRMKELRNGDFELVFVTRFNPLPARYLDRAIRRSLLRGAQGDGGNDELLFLPDSELTSAFKPRGLARGSWPEVKRPLMRPVAQRLGRAMKDRILKSIQGS